MIDWLVDLSRLNSSVPTQGALAAYQKKMPKFFMRNSSTINLCVRLLPCQQTDVVFEAGKAAKLSMNKYVYQAFCALCLQH